MWPHWVQVWPSQAGTLSVFSQSIFCLFTGARIAYDIDRLEDLKLSVTRLMFMNPAPDEMVWKLDPYLSTLTILVYI